MWIIIAGIGAVLFITVFQWRNLKRLKAAVSGQVGKFSRWIWGIDPVAIYQAEVDKSAEEIQQAREGLEQFKGMVSRLQRLVVNGEKKSEEIKVKIKSLLQSGDENKAANYALDLQRVTTQLNKDRQKLAEHEALYENNLRKVQFANQKIREAKEKAERMQSELRMSKAEVEVSKLAQSFQVKTSSIENFSMIEEEIQRQIDANRAKGQVIHDLGNDGLEELDDQELHQTQQAKLLLEQFKQEMLPPPIKVTNNGIPIDVKMLKHEEN